MLSDHQILLIVKVLIIIAALILNGYIILIFSKIVRRKSSFSDLIYLSIGISEFMIAGFTMSTQLVAEESSFNWSDSHPFICLFSIFAQYAIPDTTILSLLCLAIHISRYILAPSPSSSRTTDRFTLLSFFKLLLPWITSTFFWVLVVLVFVHTGQIDHVRCLLSPSFEFKVLKVVLLGFVPLLAIVTLNLLSIQRLNERIRRFNISLAKTQDRKSISDEAAVTFPQIVDSSPKTELKRVYLCEIWLERARKRRLRIDSRTNRNKKAVNCIFILTLSIIFTQSLYLTTWPLVDYVGDEFHSSIFNIFYELGVWLSYLTAIFNPILLCLFNVKVKSHSKILLRIILERFLTIFRLVFRC